MSSPATNAPVAVASPRGALSRIVAFFVAVNEVLANARAMQADFRRRYPHLRDS
jgi:hypothetical protein